MRSPPKKIPIVIPESDVISFVNFQSRGTLKRRGENSKALSHHLYLCMRDFGHYVGETTEVYISLYDAKKAKYIR